MSIVIVSKDEQSLAATLDRVGEQVRSVAVELVSDVEMIVVDASSGRLDEIRTAHPSVRWIDFEQPEGVAITIAHQRNVGVRAALGAVVVFTDSGCLPEPHWFDAIICPIVVGGEAMACGQVGAIDAAVLYSVERSGRSTPVYLRECPTINLAFRREVYDRVGEFDESFRYGSDIDFSWRAVHAGVRIRFVPDALVLHDWGSRKRQVERSFAYGKGRAQLYAKHVFGCSAQSIHKRSLNIHDAVPLIYPLYLLGLPLSLRYRSYLALLAIPAWRSRRDRPLQTLTEHFVLAAGVLAGAREELQRRRSPR